MTKCIGIVLRKDKIMKVEKQKIYLFTDYKRLCLFNFGKILRLHNIKTLVDLRSKKFSLTSPQFNESALTMSLHSVDIQYTKKWPFRDSQIDFDKLISPATNKNRQRANVAIIGISVSNLKKYNVEIVLIGKTGGIITC